MKFIDELRKCEQGALVRAPTQYEDPNRKWVGCTVFALLDAWDELTRDRDHYRQMAEFWQQAAQGADEHGIR